MVINGDNMVKPSKFSHRSEILGTTWNSVEHSGCKLLSGTNACDVKHFVTKSIVKVCQSCAYWVWVVECCWVLYIESFDSIRSRLWLERLWLCLLTAVAATEDKLRTLRTFAMAERLATELGTDGHSFSLEILSRTDMILVGSLEHEIHFPINSWEFHHPNWVTGQVRFFRGVETMNRWSNRLKSHHRYMSYELLGESMLYKLCSMDFRAGHWPIAFLKNVQRSNGVPGFLAEGGSRPQRQTKMRQPGPAGGANQHMEDQSMWGPAAVSWWLKNLVLSLVMPIPGYPK